MREQRAPHTEQTLSAVLSQSPSAQHHHAVPSELPTTKLVVPGENQLLSLARHSKGTRKQSAAGRSSARQFCTHVTLLPAGDFQAGMWPQTPGGGEGESTTVCSSEQPVAPIPARHRPLAAPFPFLTRSPGTARSATDGPPGAPLWEAASFRNRRDISSSCKGLLFTLAGWTPAAANRTAAGLPGSQQARAPCDSLCSAARSPEGTRSAKENGTCLIHTPVSLVGVWVMEGVKWVNFASLSPKCSSL